MAKMEPLEMDAQRAQLKDDLKDMVEKYRTIFAWDIPELDEGLGDRLIFKALRQALDEAEAASLGNRPE